jgi:hypothetical protein
MTLTPEAPGFHDGGRRLYRLSVAFVFDQSTVGQDWFSLRLKVCSNFEVLSIKQSGSAHPIRQE